MESINVLSGWGVFPVTGSRASSMITWDSEEKQAFLSGRVSGERELEITVQIGERLSLRASGERITYSELRALLPSLSFLPGDMNLPDGSPSIRRLFLDKLCALCFPSYARRLAEYRQLVRQRTALLRRNGESSAPISLSLKASTLPIAQLGGWIRCARQKAVDLLSEKLSMESSSLKSGILPFDVSVVMELHGGNKHTGLEGYIEDLKTALDAGMERERRAGLVLAGPHRDDLTFSCFGGRPAALTLSRGQKRRLVMAAVLAAGHLIETKLRLKPILILDDVAAELDADGRALMGQALAATGWQVFVSGAENPFQTADAVWRVHDGKIWQTT